MKSISLAAQAIALGDAAVVVAGGMENMSLAPHIVPMRTGIKFGATQLEDVMQKDGLLDAFDQVAMGVFADSTAEKHGVSREEQDAFAIESYHRSALAWESGVMQNEVIPVAVPQRRGERHHYLKRRRIYQCKIGKNTSYDPFSKGEPLLPLTLLPLTMELLLWS